MDEGLRITFEEEASTADQELLKTALGFWNIRVTGFDDYSSTDYFVRDADGAVRGGVLAYVWGGYLHVNTLWLDEELRGNGWGRRLMDAVHAAGRERGAEAAYLDTFSWQARPFYEKLGYVVVAETATPPGHRRYYMEKRPLQ
jgi:ribosomal protein S18 acetylase RimI-like enzyme